jgi:hypothetical protein
MVSILQLFCAGSASLMRPAEPRRLPRRRCLAGGAGLLSLALCGLLRAETIVIGSQAGVGTLADAVRVARDGDTIVVPAGEYRGDVAVVWQKQLTIRGLGPRPVLRADGRHAEGKAILVVRDGDVVIENLEFRGARVPDRNGAGIRFEKGRLQVRGCSFVDNETGLLTANFEDAELVVEDSEFAQAPADETALHHLLYVGRIASLKVTGSRFRQGQVGHLLKSRARRTELAYNLIVDGDGGRASYEVDLPNGGDALLVGNVIGQSRQSANPVVVAFGAEGHAWPRSRLRLVHNTLIGDGLRPAWFLRVWEDRLAPGTPVIAINNLLVGVGVFGTGVRGEFVGNRAAMPWMLNDADALDFALKPDSWLRRTGLNPKPTGDVAAWPGAEFELPVGTRPLTAPAAWTPGAFQR